MKGKNSRLVARSSEVNNSGGNNVSLRNWTKAHPISAYISFTMLWSWSIWSLLFLYIKPGGLLHNPPPITFLFVITGGLGPSLSGWYLTRIIYGADGVKDLKGRLTPRGLGRYGWALVVIPFVTALTPLLRYLAGYAVDIHAMLRLVGPGLALGLIAGLMEEIGWRGFLLPHLLKRYSPLTATVVVGTIWGGLWHGYADYFGLGDKGLAFLPLVLLLGPGVLTAWSLILTRLHIRTQGNLLLSILIHASISSSALIFGQTYQSIGEELVWTMISVSLAMTGAVVVWVGARVKDVKVPMAG